MAKPNVVYARFLDMQVCVPKEFTDEQVLEYAASANPCGTENGWAIRKQGSAFLAGCDERVTCEKWPENVHIALDA